MAGATAIIVDDAKVLATIAAVRAAGADLSGFLAEVGAAMLTSTQQRIEQERTPAGQPFERLKPRTVAERARAGYVPVRILRRKVNPGLYGSLTYLSTATSAEVGTNLRYAGIHQFGGTIEKPARQQTVYFSFDAKADAFRPGFAKRRKSNFARDVDVGAHTITIPARPYLGVSEEDRATIKAIGEDFIAAAAGPGATP